MILTSLTLTPILSHLLAIKLIFLSSVLPDKTSSPITKIHAEDSDFLLLFFIIFLKY